LTGRGGGAAGRRIAGKRWIGERNSGGTMMVSENARRYRNRLRIEKFLELAVRSGNLLQAALDAGFGSYAQFSRVFRQQMGVSPRGYLARPQPPR
jgi:AraC-like DNA-binding protein